jgi:hypothetical protein
LTELTGRIAEITSGPSAEMVERVVKALQDHQHRPVEVQAHAAIAAVQGAGAWRPDTPTKAESASRRATIDAALPDFTTVVEETGILKPRE